MWQFTWFSVSKKLLNISHYLLDFLHIAEIVLASHRVTSYSTRSRDEEQASLPFKSWQHHNCSTANNCVLNIFLCQHCAHLLFSVTSWASTNLHLIDMETEAERVLCLKPYNWKVIDQHSNIASPMSAINYYATKCRLYGPQRRVCFEKCEIKVF